MYLHVEYYLLFRDFRAQVHNNEVHGPLGDDSWDAGLKVWVLGLGF